eukprot:XP_014776794.1 PREDICTED: 70 kDa neurofilament protein-like [Octopus bimaculoides]
MWSDVNETTPIHGRPHSAIDDDTICKVEAAILEDPRITIRQLAQDVKELQDETTQRLIEAERVKSLENELAFRTDVHAVEMKEYRSMLSKMKNQPSLCDIPKAELESIVSDLSEEYESQLQQITTNLENRYSAQITILRNQMSSLEAELEMIQEEKAKERKENQFKVNELRSEIEVVLKQLKDLMDSKLTLETEISTYRKLLDGDDDRKNLDEVVTPVHEYQTHSENVQANALGNELNFLLGRIRVERTTKGTVSIIELDPDGKYIELKDKSPKNATNVKNWTLNQTTENGESCTHTFTDSNVFSSSKFIKIWGHKHGSVESGIVSSTVSEWSALSNPSTITLKDNNKICAVFVSKLTDIIAQFNTITWTLDVFRQIVRKKLGFSPKDNLVPLTNLGGSENNGGCYKISTD